MNAKSIIYGNMLIVEAMGGHIAEVEINDKESSIMAFLNDEDETKISVDRLAYHRDWNALMKVVRFIFAHDSAYKDEQALLIRDELCTGRTYETFVEVVKYLDENYYKNI